MRLVLVTVFVSILACGTLVVNQATARPIVNLTVAGDQEVLSGHVLGSSAGSSRLTLLAWPSTDSLHRLPVGSRVRPLTVASTAVSSDGRFSLSADASKLPSTFQASDGSISFEVQIDDGTTAGAWNFSSSREQVDHKVDFNLALSQLTQLDVKSSSVVSTLPRKVNGGIRLQAVQSAGHLLTWKSHRSKFGSIAGLANPCNVWTKSSSSQIDEEYFVQANGVLNAPAVTSENSLATHSLGIAASATSTGGWGLSGTATITTNSGMTVTTSSNNGSKWYANHVYYRLWNQSCTGARQWRPDAPASVLDRYQVVPAVTYKNCTNYNAGYILTKNSGTSATYTAGVLNSVLNLSASSSWGTDTTITWTPTVRVAMCGSDALPLSATLVEVHGI